MRIRMLLFVVATVVAGCKQPLSITDSVADPAAAGTLVPIVANDPNLSDDSELTSGNDETAENNTVNAEETGSNATDISGTMDNAAAGNATTDNTADNDGETNTDAANGTSATASNTTPSPSGASLIFNTLRIDVPNSIVEAAGVVQENVYPVVTTAQGDRIAMSCCSSTGVWVGDIQAIQDSTVTVTISWFENFQDQPLELARTTLDILISNDNPNSGQTSLDYNTSLDSDGDGASNLSERIENSNAFDALDSSSTDSFIDVIIPRVAESMSPAIDGSFVDYLPGSQEFAGEWRIANTKDRRGNWLSIDKLMIDNSGAGQETHYHKWAAVHDGSYLYILVVSDDAGLHQNDSGETGKPWKDDGLELYFDGNNSKLSSYDGVDDFHLHINLMSSSAGTANNSYSADSVLLQAVNSANLPADLIFATGLRKGPVTLRENAGRQDIYEIRIRISELNITPGEPFGFEIQLNDDDTGGTRDTKWGWSHPPGKPGADDMTWQNPAYMGTAVLAE